MVWTDVPKKFAGGYLCFCRHGSCTRWGPVLQLQPQAAGTEFAFTLGWIAERSNPGSVWRITELGRKIEIATASTGMTDIAGDGIRLRNAILGEMELYPAEHATFSKMKAALDEQSAAHDHTPMSTE